MSEVAELTGVIGHARARALLHAELRRTGGAGSTLLCGPEGVGRFRLALAAARAILGGTPTAARKVDKMLLTYFASASAMRSSLCRVRWGTMPSMR